MTTNRNKCYLILRVCHFSFSPLIWRVYWTYLMNVSLTLSLKIINKELSNRISQNTVQVNITSQIFNSMPFGKFKPWIKKICCVTYKYRFDHDLGKWHCDCSQKMHFKIYLARASMTYIIYSYCKNVKFPRINCF